MDDFIHKIPKAELHVHIEGTLEPELMFKLAKRNNIALPYSSVVEIHAAYKFKDLQAFLDLYYQGMNVLQKEEDFYDLTWAYLTKAKQQNIRHTEIFFDPQAHRRRGIPFKTVIDGIHRALQEGKKQFNISSHLIMCFLRDLSEEAAFEVLAEAMPFQEKIIGVGLDSAELENPPKKFQRVFTQARAAGFLAVAHAGEEGPPEYIWQALDLLGVLRIDHGIKCMQDLALVARLAKEQIPLTVCPISNAKLHVCKGVQGSPLKRMLEHGLCATVNSDDPAYFGGYVAENFRAVQTDLNLTKQEIYQLAKNSFIASFISDEEKQEFIEELDEFFT